MGERDIFNCVDVNGKSQSYKQFLKFLMYDHKFYLIGIVDAWTRLLKIHTYTYFCELKGRESGTMC